MNTDNIILDLRSDYYSYYQTSIWCNEIVECSRSDFDDEVVPFRSLFEQRYYPWGKAFFLKSDTSVRYFIVYPDCFDLFKEDFK